MARGVLPRTMTPVTANSAVKATDVESMIFHNSDRRETRRRITVALPGNCRSWDPDERGEGGGNSEEHPRDARGPHFHVFRRPGAVQSQVELLAFEVGKSAVVDGVQVGKGPRAAHRHGRDVRQEMTVFLPDLDPL